MNHCLIETPLGLLECEFSDSHLLSLQWSPMKKAAELPKHPLVKALVKQLKAYFQNPKHVFEMDFELQGTDFQKRVWKAMQKIPSGKVLAYQDIAKQLKSSPRAVGNACRANPIALLVPCHRVVAKSSLGGYCGMTSGPMFEIKTKLLEHENT